ncbi:MAG: alpha-amylase family protein [Saccharofermentanales bacterium]
MDNCLQCLQNEEIAVHFIYGDNHLLKKTIVNKRTGDVFTLDSYSEFEIHLQIGNDTRIFTVEDTVRSEANPVMDKEQKTRSVSYVCDYFIIHIRYSIQDNLLYKNAWLDMKSPAKLKSLYSEKSTSCVKPERGGEGQPVFFADLIFAGIEFPAADNRIAGNYILFKQSPYLDLKAGENFECYPVVFGLNNSASLHKCFTDYIRKITPIKKSPMKIYCDWGLHDELSDNKKLDSSMVDDALEKLDEIRQDGFDFDYYLMDAFWYESGFPYTKFRAEGFPEGIGHQLDKMSRHSLKFGLWFDVNFNNVCIPINGENLLQSSENRNKLCFTQPEVNGMLENALITHIKENRIQMVKFDFAYFECNKKEHLNHSSVKTESKEPAITAFLRIIQKMRKLNPDIKILAYNGFTESLEWIGSVYERPDGYAVSPWWCLYIDYIYCGDPRPSDIAADSLDKSILYYTDSMIYQFDQALFPKEFIDDHGTMVADTGTIYGLNKSGMENSLIMNILRGTNKIHFYGDIHQLDKSDVEYLRWCESILYDISEKEMHTDFILGNPTTGNTYGYSCTNGMEGYIAVINPKNTTDATVLKLKEWNNNCGIQLTRIFENGKRTDEHPISIVNLLEVKSTQHSVTVFKWELSISTHKQYFDISIIKGEKIALSLPANTSNATVYFMTADGRPLRSTNSIPEGVEISFESCNGKPTKYTKIWSGISWVRFEINGNSENSKLMIESMNMDSELDTGKADSLKEETIYLRVDLNIDDDIVNI